LLGDGKQKFHLADAKGKVVILDFWATWCGPCLQAMPQVEAVAEAFKDKDVQLIAVNLEEDPKTIQSMLERHKLKMTVALDRDGATAMKYQANAIPQTVVIDKEGNIVRLFVGGSPKLGEQLKAAVDAVLTGKPEEKPAENNGAPKVIKD
jgi:thiol-disulfide isomerase/thioredoxin